MCQHSAERRTALDTKFHSWLASCQPQQPSGRAGSHIEKRMLVWVTQSLLGTLAQNHSKLPNEHQYRENAWMKQALSLWWSHKWCSARLRNEHRHFWRWRRQAWHIRHHDPPVHSHSSLVLRSKVRRWHPPSRSQPPRAHWRIGAKNLGAEHCPWQSANHQSVRKSGHYPKRPAQLSRDANFMYADSVRWRARNSSHQHSRAQRPRTNRTTSLCTWVVWGWDDLSRSPQNKVCATWNRRPTAEEGTPQWETILLTAELSAGRARRLTVLLGRETTAGRNQLKGQRETWL